ncbi:hypothetical protein J6590_077977 [Homalodisca vitripennis]|nr:hypothetical protein J6590_077977 [Homalodisca vitripennis]
MTAPTRSCSGFEVLPLTVIKSGSQLRREVWIQCEPELLAKGHRGRLHKGAGLCKRSVSRETRAGAGWAAPASDSSTMPNLLPLYNRTRTSVSVSVRSARPATSGSTLHSLAATLFTGSTLHSLAATAGHTFTQVQGVQGDQTSGSTLHSFAATAGHTFTQVQGVQGDQTSGSTLHSLAATGQNLGLVTLRVLGTPPYFRPISLPTPYTHYKHLPFSLPDDSVTPKTQDKQ